MTEPRDASSPPNGGEEMPAAALVWAGFAAVAVVPLLFVCFWRSDVAADLRPPLQFGTTLVLLLKVWAPMVALARTGRPANATRLNGAHAFLAILGGCVAFWMIRIALLVFIPGRDASTLLEAIATVLLIGVCAARFERVIRKKGVSGLAAAD